MCNRIARYFIRSGRSRRFSTGLLEGYDGSMVRKRMFSDDECVVLYEYFAQKLSEWRTFRPGGMDGEQVVRWCARQREVADEMAVMSHE